MTEELNINLMLDTIYVQGTVNGVEADFELTAPSTWTAIVPKAEDGRYDVVITAYNSLGTPTIYTTTIYKLDKILPVKTDWTAVDYYNADDLNRVEANTQFVAEFLESIDYVIPLEPVETGRTKASIEFADSLNRVEGNIELIRENFLTPPGYAAAKEWKALMAFGYVDANRLERNLELLHKWGLIAKDNLRYCGTFYSGEEGVIC